ncbi:MAG: hypothetical protein ACT4N2_00755 [Hyphomicrobium sp.]
MTSFSKRAVACSTAIFLAAALAVVTPAGSQEQDTPPEVGDADVRDDGGEPPRDERRSRNSRNSDDRDQTADDSAPDEVPMPENRTTESASDGDGPQATERAAGDAAEPVREAAPAPIETPIQTQAPAPTPAEPASTAAQPPATPAGKPAATAGAPPAKDLYGENARQILKAEQPKLQGKVHPLSLRYPEHDVVVCTAGCGPGGKVIQKTAKSAVVSAADAAMIPTAASMDSGAAAPSDDALRCLAGCYTTPKKYRSVEQPADLVDPPPVRPETAAAAPTPNPEKHLDKQKGMGSGDWLGRINADRAVGGPAAPTP